MAEAQTHAAAPIEAAELTARLPMDAALGNRKCSSLVAPPLTVGGDVCAGRAAVGAIAAGAVGRRIQEDLAARRCLAYAEPVDAIGSAKDGQSHRRDGGVRRRDAARALGEMEVPVKPVVPGELRLNGIGTQQPVEPIDGSHKFARIGGLEDGA